MYKSTNNSKIEVTSIKEEVDGVKVSSGSSSSDISSLNPNEGDKGLKRTLKARHLTVILFNVILS